MSSREASQRAPDPPETSTLKEPSKRPSSSRQKHSVAAAVTEQHGAGPDHKSQFDESLISNEPVRLSRKKGGTKSKGGSILKVGGGSVIEPSLVSLAAIDEARKYHKAELDYKSQISVAAEPNFDYKLPEHRTGDRAKEVANRSKSSNVKPDKQSSAPSSSDNEWRFADAPDEKTSSCCAIS